MYNTKKTKAEFGEYMSPTAKTWMMILSTCRSCCSTTWKCGKFSKKIGGSWLFESRELSFEYVVHKVSVQHSLWVLCGYFVVTLWLVCVLCCTESNHREWLLCGYFVFTFRLLCEYFVYNVVHEVTIEKDNFVYSILVL